MPVPTHGLCFHRLTCFCPQHMPDLLGFKPLSYPTLEGFRRSSVEGWGSLEEKEEGYTGPRAEQLACKYYLPSYLLCDLGKLLNLSGVRWPQIGSSL